MKPDGKMGWLDVADVAPAYEDRVMVPGTKMYEMFGPQEVCAVCFYPDLVVFEQDQNEDYHHQRVDCTSCGAHGMRMDCPVVKWGDAMAAHQQWEAEQDEKSRREEQIRDAKRFHAHWRTAIANRRAEQVIERRERERFERIARRRVVVEPGDIDELLPVCPRCQHWGIEELEDWEKPTDGDSFDDDHYCPQCGVMFPIRWTILLRQNVSETRYLEWEEGNSAFYQQVGQAEWDAKQHWQAFNELRREAKHELDKQIALAEFTQRARAWVARRKKAA